MKLTKTIQTFKILNFSNDPSDFDAGMDTNDFNSDLVLSRCSTEKSSLNDEDMQPLLSELKSRSELFLDIEENKKDSQLANVEEVQP